MKNQKWKNEKMNDWRFFKNEKLKNWKMPVRGNINNEKMKDWKNEKMKNESGNSWVQTPYGGHVCYFSWLWLK